MKPYQKFQLSGQSKAFYHPNLTRSTRYRDYVYDQSRGTYYRILDSGGNSSDSGFPTDATVQRLDATQPCTTFPSPNNYLSLRYQMRLRSCGAPETLESMLRSRVRSLNKSSLHLHQRAYPSDDTLICDDKSGFVSIYHQKDRFTEITYQSIVRDRQYSVSLGTASCVATVDQVSEMVWKSGPPLNDIVLLHNAPLSEPNRGIGVSIVRAGNGSTFRPGNPFDHRLRLRGHAQGLAWCPLRDMIIFGTEGESVVLEVETTKTYQVSSRRAQCHLFNDHSLFCGGLREVQHFDLRESLRRYAHRFRLKEEAVAKRLVFLRRSGGLLVGCAGGQVMQWDPRRPTGPVAIFDNARFSGAQCSPLSVDSAERFLTCVDKEHASHVWDIRSARLLRCIVDGCSGAHVADYWDEDRTLCCFSPIFVCTYISRPSGDLLEFPRYTPWAD